MRTRPSALCFLATAALLLAPIACGEDAADEPGPQPVLPPLASMQADMSLFEEDPLALGGGSEVGLNFLTAAVVVGVARAATLVVLAVPVATFGAAISTTPEWVSPEWHWGFSVQEGAALYDADLYGRVQGGSSLWRMVINSSGTIPVLTDFTFYTGSSAVGGGSGDWHIFDPGQPAANREILDIDWLNPATNQWTLTFTNVLTGGNQTGDVLEYEVNGSERWVSYHDASESTDTTIYWDVSTGSGYIEAPNFNGGDRACWDNLGDNIVCP